LLVSHFAREFCERNHLTMPQFDTDAFPLLMQHYWSGNVRELRNVVETVLTLERGITPLTVAHFRPHLHSGVNPSFLPVRVNQPPEALERELMLRTLLDLRREVSEVKSLLVAAISRAQPAGETESTRLKDLEREQILRVLDENHGNRRKTAHDLGIGERTLYRKLKEYDIL
jgi:DNA-binding NtrC family response regulator